MCEALSLSKKTERLVALAINEARSSDQVYRHGCVVFGGGKVLGTYTNTTSRSLMSGRLMPSIHAEMSALHGTFRNSRGKDARRHVQKTRRRPPKTKLDILIVRLGGEGQLVMSRPCGDCIKALKKMGVRRVYYSTNDGEVQMEKVSDMKCGHYSYFQEIWGVRNYPSERIHF